MTNASVSDTQALLAQAEALCKQRGKRLTPIRRQVLRIMLEQQRCMKAYEILDTMTETFSQAKPATVYRALEFLEEEDLIHRLDAMNGWTPCIHLAQQAHQHPAGLLIVCTACGQVSEVQSPNLGLELQSIIKQHGYSRASEQIEIRALCQQCQPL
ncbi:transcriptional repressor [Brackiella oedipodis]|uniref:transcriptional repressor n=1 Tax=Brackiella oedipodis TaxID=124225 RepID=UPI00056DBD3B|nr:transcriptional repressor [Brackiella oedipodis]